MKFVRHAIGLAALCLCVGAHAAGSGEMTRKGQTTKLPNAYAYRQADHFDKSKMITTVLFTTKPLDTAKIDAASEQIDAAEAQLRQLEASYVELDIAADGSLEMIGFFAPGVSVSGGTSDKPVLTHNDARRIEGSFRSTDEKDKTGDFGGYYDLKFALDIPPPAAKH